MQKIDHNYWARTSWDSVNCSDVEYLAEITGRINNDPLAQMQVTSYWLPRRYFEFPMPCSTAYNLTVRARNSVGVSTPSSTYSGITGNLLYMLLIPDFIQEGILVAFTSLCEILSLHVVNFSVANPAKKMA